MFDIVKLNHKVLTPIRINLCFFQLDERKMPFERFFQIQEISYRVAYCKHEEQLSASVQFYRIQRKGSQINNLNKVIYLQHRLLDSSDTWVRNQKTFAHGFVLAKDIMFGFEIRKAIHTALKSLQKM